MSFKSLLFCPEQKTARLVTQVLNELEFTVELSNDPQSTAQKLAEEHFDALVADIANEDDAALLFKSARNSELNHSSLSVAVVEGQAGVAKAFRIGANLVLTKPINIEQSKGTLRVARGLLKKNAPTAPPKSPLMAARTAPTPISPTPILAAPAIPASLLAQPAATAPDTPFSSLEVEQEPAPAPEPAEVALLESMPDPTGTKSVAPEQTWTPSLKASAEPIAASTSSQAGAAVAPALEKPLVAIRSATPLATHEPITADPGMKETFEPAAVPVPNFSYGQTPGNTKKVVKTFVMLVLMAVAGYTAWQRLPLGQYLANLKTPGQTNDDSDAAVPAPPVANSPAASTPAATTSKPAAEPELVFPDSTPPTEDAKTTPAPRASEGSHPETIEVDELSSNPEPKVTVTPKPLVVKSKPDLNPTRKSSQPAPPTLAISPSGTPAQALANVVSGTATPMPTLQTLRVSQGVSQGLLIKKVAPIYPVTALQLHRQGSVELIATVSKEGTITAIKVLSGDPILVKSATDAVRQWKYHPYLLNGEPVEIETQITVSFKLPR